MEEKKINKSIVFSIVAVLLLVIVVAGSTYAYFRAIGETDVQEITTANLKMGFVAGEWVRADEKMMPISDAEIATKAVELPFSVTNIGQEHMNITVKLTDIVMSNELKDIDFRWGLYNTDTGKGVSFGFFKNLGTKTEELILRDTILDVGSATKNYALRIWIHDNGAAQDSFMGRTFSARVKVTGEAIEYTPESCFTILDNGTIATYNVAKCGTDVVIPKTINNVEVKKIEGYTTDYNPDLGGTVAMGAFYGKGLTSLIIPETISTLGCVNEYTGVSVDLPMLSGNNLTHLTIPENLQLTHVQALYGIGNLQTIIIPEGATQSAILENNSISQVVLFGNQSGVGTGVDGTSHGTHSFSDVVLMNGSMTSLGEYTLGSPNLTTIEIPASVTTISSNTFKIYDTLTYSPLTKIVIRGKSSLSEFTGGYAGITELANYEDIIEFRP